MIINGSGKYSFDNLNFLKINLKNNFKKQSFNLTSDFEFKNDFAIDLINYKKTNKTIANISFDVEKKKDKILIKVISPNFDLKYGLSFKELERKIKKLIRYSDPDPKRKTIFIWPEGVFTGINFREFSSFKKLISENFEQNHLILFGINTIDKETNRYFNSLLLVNNELDILYKYNKIKLVPFGEYLPFETILKKIGLKKITEGYENFLNGSEQKNLSLNNINILPLICYEIIFPELAQTANNKTNIIVNISEDGWFGKSIGPQQHFAKAIFRSIENNSYLVRSANQGISAIISNKGEILKILQPNESGNIEMNVPLLSPNYKNKNDLIFFILLFTYLIIFIILKIKTDAKK